MVDFPEATERYQQAIKGLRAAERRHRRTAKQATADGDVRAVTRSTNTADNIHEVILQLTASDFMEG